MSIPSNFSNGRTVIPATLREQLGIKDGFLLRHLPFDP